VTAAIVTCGGLCPGLNDVVQNIVFTLADYGGWQGAGSAGFKKVSTAGFKTMRDSAFGSLLPSRT
jgi:6-phosphofructokinase